MAPHVGGSGDGRGASAIEAVGEDTVLQSTLGQAQHTMLGSEPSVYGVESAKRAAAGKRETLYVHPEAGR